MLGSVTVPMARALNPEVGEQQLSADGSDAAVVKRGDELLQPVGCEHLDVIVQQDDDPSTGSLDTPVRCVGKLKPGAWSTSTNHARTNWTPFRRPFEDRIRIEDDHPLDVLSTTSTLAVWSRVDGRHTSTPQSFAWPRRSGSRCSLTDVTWQSPPDPVGTGMVDQQRRPRHRYRPRDSGRQSLDIRPRRRQAWPASRPAVDPGIIRQW